MSFFTVYSSLQWVWEEKKREPSNGGIKAFIWVMLNCMSASFRLSSAPTEVTNGQNVGLRPKKSSYLILTYYMNTEHKYKTTLSVKCL